MNNLFSWFSLPQNPKERPKLAYIGVLLASSEQGEKTPNTISDDVYEKIPDKFKVESGPQSSGEELADSREPATSEEDKSEEDKETTSKDDKGSPSSESTKASEKDEFDKESAIPTISPRSPFSPLLVLLILGLLLFLFMRSGVGSDETKISWNGFNQLLDSGEVVGGNIHGNQMSGLLRTLPTLEQLPALLPMGEKFYEGLIRRFDKKNYTAAKADPTDPSFKQYWQTIQISADKSPFGVDCYEIVYVPDKTNAKKNKPRRTGVYITKRFTCEVPPTAFADGQLDAKIREKMGSYTSTTPSDNTGWFMLISIGATFVLFWIIFRSMRRTNEQMMQGGFGNFNRSPARRYDPANKPIMFKDVAGLDNVKKELEEIVDFLKEPEKYERMGAMVPKGTLLFGPPGTGKTMLGRAVAGEAGVPFFSISGSEFIQMFVGVGASRVRDLFTQAKENAPSILFIDEIDAVGRQRGTGVGGGQDEREQTLNQILSEMDGFTPTESVMVMAATNRPDVLDPALMRPGRFDRHITVDRPTLKGRREIFEVYIKKIPAADDIDVDKLARSTVGFTGADIRNLVNEAALWATRNNRDKVDMADMEFAHEKVVLGLAREENISDPEKRKTAYHEAGHTILGWFSAIKSHVHKVTIIPRGRSLGATYFLPDEDQVNINQSEIEAMLVRYLGGRAAERLVFKESSAGAEEDLKQATQLARRMVIHWGMSERLGPVAFRTSEITPFLGREMSTENKEYSESTAQLIDEEIFRILREADDRAHRILTEKHDLLTQLAEALFEEEELDQKRIGEILGEKGSDGSPTPETPAPDTLQAEKQE
ncbi:MAG: ATP-dependent zinc metalloprotease FtsH [Planctomycetia bacterium]|nr:ATP-dependent zinc metalloprotease FtsH [Planctomycetia bacterium]